MSSHTSLLTQLDELKAATQAAATVMGPENDDLCATIAHDTELMTQLKDALTNDQLTGEQLAQLLTNRILDPARQSAQQQQQSTLDAIDKGFDTAKTSADRLSNNCELLPRGRRAKAKQTFDSSVKVVTDIVAKLAIVDRRLKRTTNKITKLCYGLRESSDDDDNANTNTRAHAEAQLLEVQQTKREQLTTEQKQLQLQLFKHFDQTLGGMSSVTRHDKQKLSIPKLNKRVKARDITDAFKSYMMHRAAEYYAVLPYIDYIADSYNPEDGTYAEAPNKEKKYCAVPECLCAAYDQQSELLFREILSCIGQAEMARITATFKCGLNKQEIARTAVGDGVTAMRNLLSKHGKNDAYTITDLEDKFAAAPQDFTFGSPALKVHNLRAQLSEVLQLGVKLKASQTMIPIIDVLSDRHPKFAVILDKYSAGGPTPNDCAVTMEQMFADIEEASNKVERAVGSEI